jgi:beta-galactosidase
MDVREFATAAAGESVPFRYRGQVYSGGLFSDLPVLREARSLGEYESTWFARTPAVTERSVGAGRALYVTTFAEERFYADFLRDVCEEAGIRPVLEAPVNEAVEIVERSAPDGRRFLFLLSYSDQEQIVELPASMDDIWNEQSVPSRCVIPPYGVRVLR